MYLYDIKNSSNYLIGGVFTPLPVLHTATGATLGSDPSNHFGGNSLIMFIGNFDN